MTIQLGWWLLPFGVWFVLFLLYVMEKKLDRMALTVGILIFLSLAGARWLP